jgi:heme/copper-type cytochrome/quinol oxidase subunit 2
MALLTQDIGLLFWLTLIIGLLVLIAPLIIFLFVVKYIRNKDKRERNNKFKS